MANIREIQSHMKSIQDTMKITNAMYLISSTKLRKARNNLESTEPYFFTLQSMIARIMCHLPDVKNVFFDKGRNKPEQDRIRGLIVITADKGLAGAYNHNVLKAAQYMYDCSEHCKFFVVGEAGRQFFKRKKFPIAEHFHYTAQNPSLHRARVISEAVMEQFKEGKLDEVHIVYTSMRNSVVSELESIQLLPIEQKAFEQKEQKTAKTHQEELLFYPSPEAVLDNILPDYIMGYIYGALVESFCSEQNARMMAMDAANKSASAMIRNLSVEYNRVRQAKITQEITEVVAGAKAQKKAKKEGH